MVGAGAVVFAVMGYVIAKQEPDKTVGSQVRLNPKLLATILGESQQSVQKAIEYLCAPDEHSTSKEEGGRRLIKLGEFDYRVVNGQKYRMIRDSEARREQNRLAQSKHREKLSQAQQKRKLDNDSRQRRYDKAHGDGDSKKADEVAMEQLPDGYAGEVL